MGRKALIVLFLLLSFKQASCDSYEEYQPDNEIQPYLYYDDDRSYCDTYDCGEEPWIYYQEYNPPDYNDDLSDVHWNEEREF